MPKIRAGLSSVLLTMELPVAILSANLILNEEITFTQIIGIVIMLGAITFMNLYKVKKPQVNDLVNLAAA